MRREYGKNSTYLWKLNMDLTIECGHLPQGGETVRGSDLLCNAGGKGGNQAVAAAKLGADGDRSHDSARRR